jgi:predicted RNase H-like HicB family nuclease
LILNIHITKTDDGFDAHVPCIKGCESWAASEDEALERILENVRYYLKLPKTTIVKVDKTKDNFRDKVYKLVFDKAV